MRETDLPLHHFQKTLEPHLNLSFPSHSKAKSSERKGTFCTDQTVEHGLDIQQSIIVKQPGKRRQGFHLLLGEILAASKVLRDLAGSKFNGVGSGKVCSDSSQPFLVVQLLVMDPTNPSISDFYNVVGIKKEKEILPKKKRTKRKKDPRNKPC